MQSTFVFVLGVLCSVSGTPMDRLTEDFTSVMLGCFDENPVGVKELEMLSNKTMPDNEAAKCLFACAYKKIGTMDDEGNFNINGLRDLNLKYFPDEAERMKATENLIQSCRKVNDEPVSDANKGCDRAGLLFKCIVDNSSDLNLLKK